MDVPVIVFLDRQHVGKGMPEYVDDRGAEFCGLHEAMLTGPIALHAESRLIELRHDVVPISDGWPYKVRHARVNGYAQRFRGAPTIYVALHLNALGGHGAPHGTLFVDYRSVEGPALAASIASVLEEMCDELSEVKIHRAKPTGWTANAYATIAHAAPVAICYEPAFIDYPGHAPLFRSQGLRRLGDALAEGTHAWATAR